MVNRLIDGKWMESRIENVLHVPGLKKNLLSVGQCTSRGYDFKFKSKYVELTAREEIIAIGVKQLNGIYRMFLEVIKPDRNEINLTVTSVKVWHERLAHLNVLAIKELTSANLIQRIKIEEKGDFFCEPCQLGKSLKLPFKNKVKRLSAPGEFIHSDVCGPMPVESVNGARYYVLFKDDSSGFRYVYFLKHKSDVTDKFMEFAKLMKNHFGRSMKTLRTDNGR